MCVFCKQNNEDRSNHFSEMLTEGGELYNKDFDRQISANLIHLTYISSVNELTNNKATELSICVHCGRKLKEIRLIA